MEQQIGWVTVASPTAGGDFTRHRDCLCVADRLDPPTLDVIDSPTALVAPGRIDRYPTVAFIVKGREQLVGDDSAFVQVELLAQPQNRGSDVRHASSVRLVTDVLQKPT